MVIGAGVGGLVAALHLSVQGIAVTLVERAERPGGKMREIAVDGVRIDAGPTVLTLRGVFDAIFAEAGTTLADHLTLKPAPVLARHAWNAETRLDLFADPKQSADAIGRFASPDEGRRYLDFCARAQKIFQILEKPFIHAHEPSLPGLVGAIGLGRLDDLWRITPFVTLWKALGTHFHDPRLRQLFGRYATYCGSSPFQAPATLMLVAHVEQAGVWLVEGGMHRIAVALARLAASHGATFRYGADVQDIIVEGGCAAGVKLASGERIAADAVVCAADSAALRQMIPSNAPRAAPRSLSAMTFSMHAHTSGFPLLRHNVFFSDDYRGEFQDIFGRSRMPEKPTVYICAQDRAADDGKPPGGPERLFCLINAPANGDSHTYEPSEIAACQDRMFRLLERCGLTIAGKTPAAVTTPSDFHRLFPATGGALYGPASHGWMASFRRPGARSRLPGLYLAGGSVHPGPGVPMAALSGRMAAASLIADLASTRPSPRAATPGGTSTR